MGKAKKKQPLTQEELLAQALVPEEEQPYKVPGNWVWTRLGNITKIIGGGTPPSNIANYYEAGNIPWITPADLSNYKCIYISHGKKNITSLGLEKSSAKLMPKNTVLLSSRAPIGYVAIAQNELCTNQGFKSFLPSIVFDSKYLYFYLKYSKEMLEKYASGTTFLELSGKKAALVEFPLPPLAEQHRIVKCIENLFEKLDRAKELVQSVLDSFETRKAAILHKAFTGELTAKWRDENGVGMESWEEATLSELSVLITKGASPKWQGVDYVCDKSQTLFITSENVREGYIDLQKEKYLDNKINDIQRRSILKSGDLLLNIVGASIGRAAIFDFDKLANINQAVCLIRLIETVSGRFINYYLNSPTALAYYFTNKVDVARANLSLADVKAIKLSLPTLPEQQEIVSILDSFFEKEQRAYELYNIIEKIDLMKKAILARAFRGELGTNDPNEESALELLKENLIKD